MEFCNLMKKTKKTTEFSQESWLWTKSTWHLRLPWHLKNCHTEFTYWNLRIRWMKSNWKFQLLWANRLCQNLKKKKNPYGRVPLPFLIICPGFVTLSWQPKISCRSLFSCSCISICRNWRIGIRYWADFVWLSDISRLLTKDIVQFKLVDRRWQIKCCYWTSCDIITTL